MDARGTTLVPVDTEQVESIVRDLVESGVESLTIALINSYVDGAHERRIGEIVERLTRARRAFRLILALEPEAVLVAANGLSLARRA
jgi:N-methylhydantoinase A/oxoprolinase/acetone carboxylase beta subunit